MAKFCRFLFSCRQITTADLVRMRLFVIWIESHLPQRKSTGSSDITSSFSDDKIALPNFLSFLIEINEIRCSMLTSKIINTMKISWHLWICSATPVETSRYFNIELLHHLWRVNWSDLLRRTEGNLKIMEINTGPCRSLSRTQLAKESEKCFPNLMGVWHSWQWDFNAM